MNVGKARRGRGVRTLMAATANLGPVRSGSLRNRQQWSCLPSTVVVSLHTSAKPSPNLNDISSILCIHPSKAGIEAGRACESEAHPGTGSGHGREGVPFDKGVAPDVCLRRPCDKVRSILRLEDALIVVTELLRTCRRPALPCRPARLAQLRRFKRPVSSAAISAHTASSTPQAKVGAVRFADIIPLLVALAMMLEGIEDAAATSSIGGNVSRSAAGAPRTQAHRDDLADQTCFVRSGLCSSVVRCAHTDQLILPTRCRI